MISRFEISSKNQNIFGELTHDKKSKDICILVHGFKGYYKWGFFRYIKERLLAQGIATFAFNFSYGGIFRHGNEITEFDTFSKNTFERELDDLHLVRDFIESDKNPVKYNNCYNISHSRGGYISLLFASENPQFFDKIVSLAAVSHYVDRYSKKELDEFKKKGFAEFINNRTGDILKVDYAFQKVMELDKDRYDLLKKIDKIDSKVLFIHGDHDETISVSEMEKLFHSSNKKNTQKRIIKNAGHTFNYSRENGLLNVKLNEVINASLQFLKNRD